MSDHGLSVIYAGSFWIIFISNLWRCNMFLFLSLLVSLLFLPPKTSSNAPTLTGTTKSASRSTGISGVMDLERAIDLCFRCTNRLCFYRPNLANTNTNTWTQKKQKRLNTNEIKKTTKHTRRVRTKHLIINLCSYGSYTNDLRILYSAHKLHWNGWHWKNRAFWGTEQKDGSIDEQSKQHDQIKDCKDFVCVLRHSIPIPSLPI